MKSRFEVGAASADITPLEPLPNYNGQIVWRSARTVPLRSHVVLCRHGTSSCAMIAVDATFVDRPLVAQIRKRVADVTGIPVEHILVAATHSHATPATCPSFLSGALPNSAYLDFLVDQTTRAAANAAQRFVPVRIAAGTMPSPIGWCRRWVDPSGQAHFMPENHMQSEWKPESSEPLFVRYLLFEDDHQVAQAAVVNVPCHNNFVFEVYHADFFGVAGQYLQKRWGAELVPLFIPAPSGDIACRRPEEFGLPGDAISLAHEAGQMLGEAIEWHAKSVARRDVKRLICRSIERSIPDRGFEDSDFCHDDCRGDSDEVRQRIRRRYDPEEAAVRQRGVTSCDVEVQCIVLGEVAIVTNPAELFSAYDGVIQRDSPFAITLVSELTNGYCGYVPTPEAFSHGCYETHRTVFTSRLVKDAGEQIADLSVALLRELA